MAHILHAKCKQNEKLLENINETSMSSKAHFLLEFIALLLAEEKQFMSNEFMQTYSCALRILRRKLREWESHHITHKHEHERKLLWESFVDSIFIDFHWRSNIRCNKFLLSKENLHFKRISPFRFRLIEGYIISWWFWPRCVQFTFCRFLISDIKHAVARMR